VEDRDRPAFLFSTFARWASPWQHAGMSSFARRSLIGVLAGVVLSLHALAVPTVAGACAQASLHHAQTEVIAVEEVIDSGDSSVEADDAQLGRDLRSSAPTLVTMVVPSHPATYTTLRDHVWDLPPPDQSELSIWRT
jgi:hypothetical protein